MFKPTGWRISVFILAPFSKNPFKIGSPSLLLSKGHMTGEWVLCKFLMQYQTEAGPGSEINWLTSFWPSVCQKSFKTDIREPVGQTLPRLWFYSYLTVCVPYPLKPSYYCRKKTLFYWTNNKAAEQPANPRSQTKVFAIHSVWQINLTYIMGNSYIIDGLWSWAGFWSKTSILCQQVCM